MTPEEIKKGETDRIESMESFLAEHIGKLAILLTRKAVDEEE